MTLRSSYNNMDESTQLMPQEFEIVENKVDTERIGGSPPEEWRRSVSLKIVSFSIQFEIKDSKYSTKSRPYELIFDVEFFKL